MKKTNAELAYIVEASCPYCSKRQDLIHSDLDEMILDAVMDNQLEDLGIVVKCQDCQEKFELNDIDR